MSGDRIFGPWRSRFFFAALLAIVACNDGTTRDPSTTRRPTSTEDVQGVACTGSVSFYDNGALRTALLARDDTLFNNILPAGSVVTFREDSTLKWTFLAHDAPLEGILCRGDGDNYMNAFHTNGRLQLAWLSGDQVVQGIPCMGATFWRDVAGGGVGVHFASNGRLIRAKLSRDIVIQGRSFQTGDQITFDSLGVLLP